MADAINLLSTPALTCVVAQFRQVFTGQLDERYVQYSLDPVNAKLLFRALPQGTDGSVGIYEHDASCTYGKADLSKLLPYPLVYDGPWPTTYRALKAYMLNKYTILLEEGEFAITNNLKGGVLQGDDPVNAIPDPMTGEVTLVAAASSGRFANGTAIRLVLTPAGGPARLVALLPSSIQPDLVNLTDQGQ